MGITRRSKRFWIGRKED
ncbi:hypothetical protein C5167_003610 [Papaver somniferum]|uniref:Uncharacterized protein n=1 Tax=Papaver somniferum TaxID=3469 RepID=A0A4Y7L355_PAPSO|nr:hypothetical protein C5167_003610 [Papaver somniferum]